MKYTLRRDLPLEEQERLRAKDREQHKKRKHRDSYKEYKRQDYLKNKQHRTKLTKISLIKRKYGISWKEFEKVYEVQEGLCAICKQEEKNRMLAIDHCHVTRKVRGLLCGPCNRALGLFKDDPELLQAAKEYVS